MRLIGKEMKPDGSVTEVPFFIFFTVTARAGVTFKGLNDVALSTPIAEPPEKNAGEDINVPFVEEVNDTVLALKKHLKDKGVISE